MEFVPFEHFSDKDDFASVLTQKMHDTEIYTWEASVEYYLHGFIMGFIMGIELFGCDVYITEISERKIIRNEQNENILIIRK
ncbi:Hypothetical protein HVR_LOCUS514 [uncultured virus]|nr:Hypothetical protein HVR_LOCUS514 [uncultured virus]